MDLTTLQVAVGVLSALATVASAAAGAIAWSARRAVKSAQIEAAATEVPGLRRRLDEGEKELGNHRLRINTLEKQVAALPTEKALADIHTLLERLEGKINTAAARTENADRSAAAAMEACNRIEGFFIKKGVDAS